jgi:gliding motility-associated-like protein
LDFNPATGIVENPISLQQDNYGVEFSASGTILYVSTLAMQVNNLYQYDLQSGNIMGTATELLSVDISGRRIGALQRGPDNKIYIAHDGATALSVINQPDIMGTGCGFTENGLSLSNGSLVSCDHGLPNNALAPAYRVSISRQLSCVGQESNFWVTAPQGTPDTVLWEFGDGSSATQFNPSHTYLMPGIYTARLTAIRQGTTRIVESTVEIINAVPINQPADIVACEEDGGSTHFNLAAQNAAVLGTLDPNDYIITYHTTPDDAESGSASLPLDYVNLSSPQTIYARLETLGSGCYATTSFDLVVTPQPAIDIADSFPLCKGETILLEAPEGFEVYHWSTGENSRSILVDNAGTYTVSVGSTANGVWCGNSKTVTVYISDAPTITQLSTGDWTDSHNSISISVSGSGSYEYSLDGFTYQDSPEFYELDSGIYNVYARDKNGCGTDIKEVVLLMYPKFFTPNGDGINDTWRIKYSWKEPELSVHIFDRYGKLITSFKGNGLGWDGKHNGNNLPATDYWFVVERMDERVLKGHFSLIR